MRLSMSQSAAVFGLAERVICDRRAAKTRHVQTAVHTSACCQACQRRANAREGSGDSTLAQASASSQDVAAAAVADAREHTVAEFDIVRQRGPRPPRLA